MRVTRKKAEENRRRVVDIAGRRFRERGLDGIGVADLMREAGLTHGGFYGQFESKEHLAAEVVADISASAARRWRERAARGPVEGLKATARHYLSRRHCDDRSGGCPAAALGADAARRDGPVRRAYTDGVRGLLDALTDMVPGDTEEDRRREANATLAGLVGAVVLSRAVDDADLSEAILEAMREKYGVANGADA